MLRIVVPALFVLGLAATACGGDDSSASNTPSAAGTTAVAAGQQPTADRPLPTPTPAVETAVAVSVAAGGKTYAPTVAEFRGLPTVEIAVDGGTKGVTVDTLARKVGAAPGAVVTMQGYRADMKTIAFVRKPLSEVASTTVFVVDSAGHLNVASTSLAKEEWLRAVIMVAFQ